MSGNYPAGVSDADPHFDLPDAHVRTCPTHMRTTTNPTICYLCGREAGRGPDGLMVRECMRCEREVCEGDADTDADCVGDPPQFVLTQWICDSLKGGCREHS